MYCLLCFYLWGPVTLCFNYTPLSLPSLLLFWVRVLFSVSLSPFSSSFFKAFQFQFALGIFFFFTLEYFCLKRKELDSWRLLLHVLHLLNQLFLVWMLLHLPIFCFPFDVSSIISFLLSSYYDVKCKCSPFSSASDYLNVSWTLLSYIVFRVRSRLSCEVRISF